MTGRDRDFTALLIFAQHVVSGFRRTSHGPPEGGRYVQVKTGSTRVVCRTITDTVSDPPQASARTQRAVSTGSRVCPPSSGDAGSHNDSAHRATRRNAWRAV